MKPVPNQRFNNLETSYDDTDYTESALTDVNVMDCMTIEEAIEYTCQSVRKIYEEAGEL